MKATKAIKSIAFMLYGVLIAPFVVVILGFMAYGIGQVWWLCIKSIFEAFK